MKDNSAAWLVQPKMPLQLGPAPLRTLAGDEILVRNRAIAINPVDWIMQCMPTRVAPWVKLPLILGSDVSGEVVAVGLDVTRFQVGDRVLGHAVGLDRGRNYATEGAFQTFTVLQEHMASAIPGRLSHEDACVLPLGLSTAACGLFQKDQLALQYPTDYPVANEETLLVWGGSTSVGCNAIQLGTAAGYRVIATASTKNFALLRELGAAETYDYKDPLTIAEVIKTLRSRKLAGAISIGTGSVEACSRIAAASGAARPLLLRPGRCSSIV